MRAGLAVCAAVLMCFPAAGQNAPARPPGKDARPPGSQTLALPSGDQPAQEAMLLTIDEAVALALRQNRNVLQAEEAVAAARAALDQARALQGWTLAGSARVAAMGPTSSFRMQLPTGAPIEITLTPNTAWQLGLTATQPLYHGGKLYLQELMARLGLDRATLERDATARQVARDVRQLFLTVVQAQQLEQVAAENVSRAARHLQDARARVEAGVAPGFDVVQAEAQVANANDGLVAARAAVEKALGALKTLLAVDVLKPVRLQPPSAEEYIEVDEAGAIRAALAHRPELAAIERAVRMAETSVRLAQATSKPSIDLFAQYQKQSTEGFGGHDWNWTLGVQASKLIFDHGLTRASVQQAEAELRRVREMQRQAQEAVALEVYQACVSLREAGEKIAAAEKGVLQAEEAMRIADLRYQEGVSTPVEVTDARTALVSARANLVNARFAYEQAKIALQYAIGMPLEEFLQGRGEAGPAVEQGEAAPAGAEDVATAREAPKPAPDAPQRRPSAHFQQPQEHSLAAGGEATDAQALRRYVTASSVRAR
ncbi:MAG: TolC family protein [Armatimonadetes bacterium]|nr:TolC family protein [Armatimonadota bacterium]